MKKMLMALVMGAALTCSGMVFAEEEYILTPGDQLQIIIEGHADISNSVANRNDNYMVRPDGLFEFPLIGVVDTKGKTISQLKQEMSQRLAEYIIEPSVLVNVAALGTTRVFVLGEVKKPGMIELTKSHRVLDAVGAAGGFTELAAKKKIYLVREGREESVQKLNFNNFLTKGDISQNLVLQEGDCLYLTSNHKLSFVKDILPTVQRFVNSWYNVERTRTERRK